MQSGDEGIPNIREAAFILELIERKCPEKRTQGEVNKGPRRPTLPPGGFVNRTRRGLFIAGRVPRPSSLRNADTNCLNVECRCPGTFPRLLQSSFTRQPATYRCNAAVREGKLLEPDSDRASPAKVAAVENAISQAAFIVECIDRKWPRDQEVLN